MIDALASASPMAFGVACSCPHCGRDGLASRHAPCPSCGQDVTAARQVPGQEGQYVIERGETNRSLAEELKEEQRKRLEAGASDQESGPGMNHRAAAAALEAGIDAGNRGQAEASPHDAEKESSQHSPEKLAAQAAGASAGSLQGLSESELAMLRDLQQRDSEVRSHEQAHISAGGDVVTGGASYTYQTGPDGKQYAIGGEVSIDTSPVPNDPEATEEKAQTIRRAALAPASPSAQDQKVAAQAAQMEAEARMEQLEQRRLEQDTADPAGLAAAALSPPSGLLQPEVHEDAAQRAAGEHGPAGPAGPEQRLPLVLARGLEHYAAMQQHTQQPASSGFMQRKVLGVV